MEKILKDIEKKKMRLKNAKELMLDGEFSAAEFKEMKNEIEDEIEQLKRELTTLNGENQNYGGKIDACLKLLVSLHKHYISNNVGIKQRIIGSIFPDKLIFENKIYRTAKINEVVALIFKDNGYYKGNKKGQLLL